MGARASHTYNVYAVCGTDSIDIISMAIVYCELIVTSRNMTRSKLLNG